MKKRPRISVREERLVAVELRAAGAEGGMPTIVGHPVRYNVWSQDLGGFRERILPGSATKTLSEGDIRVLFNHDPNIVLGRNKSGTAAFRDEAAGIHMECTPPDTQLVRDMVIAPMERDDVNQMSFAFRALQDEWRAPDDPNLVKKDGLWERDIREFQMYDGSIVTFPAYVQTDVGLRATFADGLGLDLAAVAALMTRHSRGVSLTDSDIDLLKGSIELLRSYLPSEPDADGAPLDEPEAGRSVDHLRRLLEVKARFAPATA